jgi:DNA-binding CsgD family transcriptional regulator
MLDRLRSGSGSVVIVEGVPGIGKTRLVSEAVGMARRASVRAGVGVADPGESMAELAPLLRALFDGPKALLDRGSLGSLRVEPERRYWLLQDLQSLLERAALSGPMVICLDDLQWADGGTVASIRALPPRLHSLPIGWVLAMRPAQGAARLGAAMDQLVADGAVRLVLQPLDQTAVAEVAADVVQARPDQAVLDLVADAGGNPFLLVELLLGLQQEQLLRVDAGRGRLTANRLPDRVRAGMRERLSRMSEPARQVATVAGSLSGTFSFGELAAMLGVQPASLLVCVDQLIEAGVLRDRADRLSFQHDLIREAVRDATPVSIRRAIDRQAIDVLLAAGALPVDVATQLASSAEPGDEGAIATLRDAAEALGASNPGAAADLSRRALDLTPRRHVLRGSLVAQTTVLLHAAARSDEAKAFADEHLKEVLPTAEEANVCLSVASMFALSPDIRAAASRRALELPGLAVTDRARHSALLAYNMVHAGRPVPEELQAEMRSTVAASGDTMAESIADLAAATLLYVDGEFAGSLRLHETAMRRGFGLGQATRERVTHQWRCELLAVLDRLDESLASMADGITVAHQDRQGWAIDFFETWRGRQLFQRGRLTDAAATLDGRFDPQQPNTYAGSLYASALVAAGRVAIHTDDERRGREAAKIATLMVEAGTPAARRHGAWLLALRAMDSSDPVAAGRWVRSVADSGRPLILPLHPMDVTDEPHLVRIAMASGDHELAAAATEMAEHRAQRSPQVHTVLAVAAHCRGLLDDNVDCLATAVALLSSAQRPLALGLALEDLGVGHLRLGERELGIEALGRALSAYSEVGATSDVRRVRARLRTHGVRRRRTATERPDRGWAALTDSELAVARLICEGLTNREAAERLFVSPHTVNSHLRHAFTKLEINSRVGLARLFSEHGTQK